MHVRQYSLQSAPLRPFTIMTTGLFALLLLVVRTIEASTLTIEGKSLSVETGANVSTVSNTLRGVSIIKCVGECMLGTCNMVGYHKPTKTCFISTDLSYDVISVSDSSYRVVNLLGRIISQWVDRVFNVSSEHSNIAFKAGEVVGKEDAYGADLNSWSSASSNSKEFIEVVFSTTVKVTSVEIFKPRVVGGVTGIECFQDKSYHSINAGEATTLQEAVIFSPILTAPCVSNQLKIHFFTAPRSDGNWIIIDAIRLNGTLV